MIVRSASIFIEGDALSECYKFKTWGVLSAVCIPTLLSQRETTELTKHLQFLRAVKH